MKIELHEHQADAVRKMHNGCVLWGDVGTGKTITALAYALLKEADKHIVVVTTAKKRDSWDWQREAALLGVDVEGIEVTSWNKISEYIDRSGQFFIFDEQRLVGTGAWVKSFYKIAKANSWIVLSATPGDTWSDYAPMFIANGWYKNVTEFRREHAVYSRFTNFPKIERYIGEGKLKKYRQHLLVKMPMARHTTRHMIYVDCEWDQARLDIVRKKRWNPFTDEPIKSAAEMFTAMRRIVSTDDSRRRQFEALLQQHDKMIVFYNFNYELEILRDILSKHQSMMDSPGSKTTTSIETNTESREISTSESKISFDAPTWTSFEKKSGLRSISSSSDKTKESPWTGFVKPVSNHSIAKEDNSCPLPLSTASKSSSSTSAGRSVPSSVSPSSSDSTSPPTTVGSTMRDRTSSMVETPTLSTSRTSSFGTLKTPTTPKSLSRSGSGSSSTAPTTSALRSEPWPSHNDASVIGQSSNSRKRFEPSSSKSSSKTIEKLSSGSFGWSEWNGHKHEPIPTTDRWVYLVQYASGSEGWNCIETNVMVFWSLTYSWKQWWQAQGRIDRMNTPFTDLYYIIMRTKSPAELPVVKSLNQKKDFQPK